MSHPHGQVEPKEPLTDSLKRFVVHSVDLLQGRFELLKLELGEERERVGDLVTRGLFAAFFIFLTVQLFAVLLIALAWDTTWRIPVIAGLAVASLMTCFLLVRAYKATQDSTLFESSVDEVAKDVHAIDGMT